jgi:glycerol uptake facilitator-like aquaporin
MRGGEWGEGRNIFMGLIMKSAQLPNVHCYCVQVGRGEAVGNFMVIMSGAGHREACARHGFVASELTAHGQQRVGVNDDSLAHISSCFIVFEVIVVGWGLNVVCAVGAVRSGSG